MDQEDVIRDQIEQTQKSLAKKLETLEKEVASTTTGVAQTVSSVTDAVQESVDAVKDGVQESMAAVSDGVQAIRGMFDFPQLTRDHPWAMCSGSLAFGFCLGQMLSRSVSHVGPPGRTGGAGPRDLGGIKQSNGKHGEQPAPPTKPGILAEFMPVLNAVKGLALGALLGVVRDIARDALPREIYQPVEEMIAGAGEKLGANPPKPAAPSRPATEPLPFATANRM